MRQRKSEMEKMKEVVTFFVENRMVSRMLSEVQTDSNYKIDHGANPGKQNRTRNAKLISSLSARVVKKRFASLAIRAKST